MRRALKRTITVLATVLLFAGLFSACDRTVSITGTVYDIQGQTLPGVAVTMRNKEYQALSDPKGNYTMRCPPGVIELNLMKTGYTPGRLDLTVLEARPVEAAKMVLWPLPQGKGVYLFEHYRYRDTSRAEPTSFLAKNLGAVYGIKKTAEATTLATQPALICFRLPFYDVHFYALRKVDASDPNSSDETYNESIWLPASEIPVTAMPIDEPGRQLIELHYDQVLTPGSYAVDWGAFDGHSAINPAQVFLFRVITAEEAAAPPETPKKKDDKKKAASKANPEAIEEPLEDPEATNAPPD